MAHISSLNSSLPVTDFSSEVVKTSSTAVKQKASQASDETQASPLQAQLTRLSSVLSSLQTNASNTRAHFLQVSNQVKAGTYSINSLDVSKALVQDLLPNHK